MKTKLLLIALAVAGVSTAQNVSRSEERRVGKEC